MFKLALFSVFFVTGPTYASPPVLEQVLRDLRIQIESLPTDEAAYLSPTDEFTAELNSQFYKGLGAWRLHRPGADPAQETMWQVWRDPVVDRLAKNLSAHRPSPVLELGERMDVERQARLVRLYLDLIPLALTRIETENLAHRHQRFIREVDLFDTDVAEELWVASQKGHISDELVAKWAGGHPKINGFIPRDYLNLRLDLARKNAGRTVGNLAMRRFLNHLAWGADSTIRYHPGDGARLNTYVRNVVEILRGLMGEGRPTHPGSWLAILDTAAVFVSRLDTLLSEKHPNAPAVERLYAELAGHIRQIDVVTCEIELDPAGLTAQLHNLLPPL